MWQTCENDISYLDENLIQTWYPLQRLSLVISYEMVKAIFIPRSHKTMFEKSLILHIGAIKNFDMKHEVLKKKIYRKSNVIRSSIYIYT